MSIKNYFSQFSLNSCIWPSNSSAANDSAHKKLSDQGFPLFSYSFVKHVLLGKYCVNIIDIYSPIQIWVNVVVHRGLNHIWIKEYRVYTYRQGEKLCIKIFRVTLCFVFFQ